MANRYDNLAYDYNSCNRVNTFDAQKNPNLRIKAGTKSNKQTKVKYNYSAILRLAVIAAFAFLVLCRGVIITDKANELTNLKKQLDETNAKNQQLQVEIEKSLDLTRIETIASEKLNMRRPEKYQIVYLNLDRVDYVEKVGGVPSESQEKTTKLLNNLKAYLD